MSNKMKLKQNIGTNIFFIKLCNIIQVLLKTFKFITIHRDLINIWCDHLYLQ